MAVSSLNLCSIITLVYQQLIDMRSKESTPISSATTADLQCPTTRNRTNDLRVKEPVPQLPPSLARETNCVSDTPRCPVSNRTAHYWRIGASRLRPQFQYGFDLFAGNIEL